MAKITRQKCRKEIICSKCGKPIVVGEEYLKGAPFRRKPICRHVSCGLQSWELSGSEFVQTCGSIQCNWRENYSADEAGIESIVGDLEDLRDTCQDSYDNMPEGLQYSDNGCMLEERIDILDEVINELENIDVENITSGELDEFSDDNDGDWEDPDDIPEDLREDFDAALSYSLGEAIDEALSGLEY